MAWQRQIPSLPEQPAPPASGRWLLGFMLAIIVSIMLFLLHAANHLGGLQAVNIWLVAVIPLVGYLLAFSLRSYLFGQALSQYHFLQDEAQTAQREWHQWAERYMAVLASCVLLPDKITASFLVKQPADLPSQLGLTRRIDYLTEGQMSVRFAITTLLGIIADPLTKLPQTQPLHVTLVTDSDMEQETLSTLFSEGWLTTMPGHPAPLDVSVQSSLSYDLIESRIREAQEAVDLILVLQLEGEERYSDGLSVFLLTPDDAAKKHALPVTGRLLRPMLLDPQHLASEMALFFDTQPLSLKAPGLLGDCRDFLALTYQIVPTCSDKGGALTIDKVMTLERAIGLTGPLSAWLLAGLCVDFCRCQEIPYLMFSQSAPYWFVSTVSPGVVNEDL
ncbi:hypothetical protein C9426_33960 [Serratia sp. S1B]|nr:hypothetical protein C9426_33960 [Serratia sp. S1B]